jgi:hypothetical protein
MKPLLLSRILSGWILFVLTFLYIYHHDTEYKDIFYRWGPHPNLHIVGVTIDTWTKYTCIILYCLVNTTLRNVDQNILRPYITLHIQDETPEAMIRKRTMDHAHAYEIVVLTTVYTWFDWFMYIQILLTQVDMIVIEAATDIVVSLVITRHYLKDAEHAFPYFQI